MRHHGRGLFHLTRNQPLVDQLKKDFRKADIDGRDMAMLDYAEKVTLRHCECRSGDIDVLRDVGFEDVEILDIVQVSAYYNFVNRMACGLGVELESYWSPTP